MDSENNLHIFIEHSNGTSTHSHIKYPYDPTKEANYETQQIWMIKHQSNILIIYQIVTHKTYEYNSIKVTNKWTPFTIPILRMSIHPSISTYKWICLTCGLSSKCLSIINTSFLHILKSTASKKLNKLSRNKYGWRWKRSRRIFSWKDTTKKEKK